MQIKKHEVLCIKAINYKILTNSAYDFIKFFLGVGSVFSNDYVNYQSKVNAMEDSDEDEDFNNDLEEGKDESSVSDSSLNDIDKIEMIEDNNKKENLKSVVGPNFYTEVMVDKVYSIAYNILDVYTEGNVIFINLISSRSKIRRIYSFRNRLQLPQLSKRTLKTTNFLEFYLRTILRYQTKILSKCIYLHKSLLL